MRSRKLASPILVFVWALSGPALGPHSDFVWTISRHYGDFFRPCLTPLGTCVGPPRPFDGSLRLCVCPLVCLLLSQTLYGPSHALCRTFQTFRPSKALFMPSWPFIGTEWLCVSPPSPPAGHCGRFLLCCILPFMNNEYVSIPQK